MDREALLAADITDWETSLQPFFAWVARVIPDDESRSMFYDICAQKLQDPMNRPLSVIMVAEQEGVGRDILFSIIQKVFGESYCAERTFERLNDRFNNDLETASWVHVPEIMDPGSTDRQHKAKMERIRETLKELFSPGHCTLRIEGKHMNARTCPVHFTGFITTNHLAAVPVTKGSRRFLVIRNGRLPTKDEIASIVSWRSNPMNPVALRMWLRERTITSNVFQAPQLKAHRETVEHVEAAFKESTRTQSDEAADAFLADCPTDVFTLAQFNRWVDLHTNEYGWKIHAEKDAGRLRYAMLRRSTQGDRVCHPGVHRTRYRIKATRSAELRELDLTDVQDQLNALDAYLDGIAHEQNQAVQEAAGDLVPLSGLEDLNLELPE
jgi:hypothetical protein